MSQQPQETVYITSLHPSLLLLLPLLPEGSLEISLGLKFLGGPQISQHELLQREGEDEWMNEWMQGLMNE